MKLYQAVRMAEEE